MNLDDKWSEEVAKKYNHKCIHCNSPLASSHHIIPRQCKKTRYILECGIYCCNSLHRIFEGKKGKKKQLEAIRIFVGIQRYENLDKIRKGISTPEEFNYMVIK